VSGAVTGAMTDAATGAATGYAAAAAAVTGVLSPRQAGDAGKKTPDSKKKKKKKGPTPTTTKTTTNTEKNLDGNANSANLANNNSATVLPNPSPDIDRIGAAKRTGHILIPAASSFSELYRCLDELEYECYLVESLEKVLNPNGKGIFGSGSAGGSASGNESSDGEDDSDYEVTGNMSHAITGGAHGARDVRRHSQYAGESDERYGSSDMRYESINASGMMHDSMMYDTISASGFDLSGSHNVSGNFNTVPGSAQSFHSAEGGSIIGGSIGTGTETETSPSGDPMTHPPVPPRPSHLPHGPGQPLSPQAQLNFQDKVAQALILRIIQSDQHMTEVQTQHERRLLESVFGARTMGDLSELAPFVRELIVEDSAARLYAEMREGFVRIGTSTSCWGGGKRIVTVWCDVECMVYVWCVGRTDKELINMAIGLALAVGLAPVERMAESIVITKLKLLNSFDNSETLQKLGINLMILELQIGRVFLKSWSLHWW
jgi:hypothetical protein